jgi:hypothetical protein
LKSISVNSYILLAGVVLGLILYLAAPGNYMRLASFNDVDRTFNGIILGTTTLSLNYLKMWLYKLHYVILFLTPVSILFSKSSFVNKKSLMYGAIIVTGSIIIQAFVLYYAKGFNDPRTLYILDFLFLSFVVFSLTFLTRQVSKKSVLLLTIFVFIALAGQSAILIRRYIISISDMRLYSKSYDLRIDYIEKLDSIIIEPKTPIFVEPLPFSSWLQNSDIRDEKGVLRIRGQFAKYSNLRHRVIIDTSNNATRFREQYVKYFSNN